MLNYEYTVYVDMDGVLAHFDARIKEITGKESHELKRGHLWSAVQKHNDEVAPFYETLDKMPDADELWNFCKDNFHIVKILTATGHTPKDVVEQKIRWAHKTYGTNTNVKTVASSELKAIYANPRSILIDDREKSIGPWVKAGGVGILHTNAGDSIKQLQKILGKSS